MFEELGIRDCCVRLDRLIESEIPAPPKKKLLPSDAKLRTQVSWLPSTSSVLVNSSEARASLAVYQGKNDIVPPVARKNVLRQRAKSMFLNRASVDAQSNDMNGMKCSNDNIAELQTKFSSPYFGLKPFGDRLLVPKQQQPLTDFQKIFGEFKKRVESKLAKK